MLAIATLLFGMLALLTLANGIQSLRAQAFVPQSSPPEDWEKVRGALRSGVLRNVLIGICFAAASGLVWSSWPLALVVGGWPVVLFALLAATGRITVIGRLGSVSF